MITTKNSAAIWDAFGVAGILLKMPIHQFPGVDRFQVVAASAGFFERRCGIFHRS
jgi:hypothetical protein|tara:strand:- start:1148 stop:1312 length:165 start_codon:yes stop_codon:yes gene_type:complete